ncbi:hypothetical protein V8C37DRAFT_416445 [Trichoderma ceciliae]
MAIQNQVDPLPDQSTWSTRYRINPADSEDYGYYFVPDTASEFEKQWLFGNENQATPYSGIQPLGYQHNWQFQIDFPMPQLPSAPIFLQANPLGNNFNLGTQTQAQPTINGNAFTNDEPIFSEAPAVVMDPEPNHSTNVPSTNAPSVQTQPEVARQGKGQTQPETAREGESQTRTGEACKSCRKRKSKCDSDPDGCQNCKRYGIPCLTVCRVTGEVRERSHVKTLEGRCGHLLEYVKTLHATMTENGVSYQTPDEVQAILNG